MSKCGQCCTHLGTVIAYICVCICIFPILIAIVGIPIMKFYNLIHSIVSVTEWQNKSISNARMLESVALPFECHKIDVYLSHISPLFMEVKAPSNAGISLTLQEENTTDSHIIDICFALANEICSISIGGYDEIFAFASLVPGNNTEDGVVQWSCSYLNVSLLVVMIILACCGCIGMLCSLSACICLIVKKFCDSSDMKQTPKTHKELTSKSLKWKLSILSNSAETQPLLKHVKVADCPTEVVN